MTEICIGPAADMFPATYGWDICADSELRQARIADGARYGNSARENDEYLFELSQFVGMEGYDYQNPYAFAARGVLEYPTPWGSQLDPNYGVGDSLPVARDILLNIKATAGVIHK